MVAWGALLMGASAAASLASSFMGGAAETKMAKKQLKLQQQTTALQTRAFSEASTAQLASLGQAQAAQYGALTGLQTTLAPIFGAQQAALGASVATLAEGRPVLEEQRETVRRGMSAAQTASRYLEAAGDVTSPLFRQTAAMEELKLRRTIAEGLQASELQSRRARARGLTAGVRSERQDEARQRALTAAYGQASMAASGLASERLRTTGAGMLGVAGAFGQAAQGLGATAAGYGNLAAGYGSAAAGYGRFAAGVAEPTLSYIDLVGQSAESYNRIVASQAANYAAATGGGAVRGAEAMQFSAAANAAQRARYQQGFDIINMLGQALGGQQQLASFFGGGAAARPQLGGFSTASSFQAMMPSFSYP